MGFLAPAAGIVANAIATAMIPPPEPDITRWCEENVIFDDRSPVPGAFNIEKFPFLRQIHEVLSPRGRRSSTCTHPSPALPGNKNPMVRVWERATWSPGAGSRHRPSRSRNAARFSKRLFIPNGSRREWFRASWRRGRRSVPPA